MRLFASLSLIFCFFGAQIRLVAQSVPSSTETRKYSAFGLPDGTPVKLRLTRNMSSADAKTGETVDFEVIEDVKIGDTTIIPRGGVAIGTVTRGKAKGRMGRGGKLDINIDYVRSVLSEKISLRAVKETKGSNNTGAMTGAIVATSLIFLPAAPLFLFLKGKDINIPKGTEITAYVSGNFEFDSSQYAAAQSILGGKPQTSRVGLVNVTIKSEPDGAEIWVDGKFIGSSPSSIFLRSGEHTITVKKSGFRTWERFMRLEPGSNITVNATMSPFN